jgi:hypothetical protein
MPKYRIISNTQVTRVHTYTIEADTKEEAIQLWQEEEVESEGYIEQEGLEQFGRIEEIL